MKMPDGRDSNQSSEDRILSRLIKAARQSEGGDFVRPADDAIVAYLMGTASPEQDRLMKSALRCSEAFRREILRLAKDMEKLEEETLAEVEAHPVPRAPSRQEFLRSYGDAPPRDRDALSLLTRLRGLRGIRILVPAAIVGALVILVTVRTTLFGPGRQEPGAGTLLLVQNLVAPEELIGIGARRGHPAEMEKTYDSPDEAAKAVFRGLLEWNGSEFVFVPAEGRPERQPLKEPRRELVLRFVDDRGTETAEFTAAVPFTSGTRPRFEAYLLTLPATALYRTAIAADTMWLVWPDSLGVKGCVAFTYPCQGGYCAAGGDTFDIQ